MVDLGVGWVNKLMEFEFVIEFILPDTSASYVGLLRFFVSTSIDFLTYALAKLIKRRFRS